MTLPSATEPTPFAESRLRGMLLGLALGDSLGDAAGRLPATGPLRAGVSTQLACFTAEGLIRASVRMNHRGICHPPSVIFHAYARWAALQGLHTEHLRSHWGHGGSKPWPNGWLASVPVLAERRGSAPATVDALGRGDAPGHTGKPLNASRGCHALTRVLPLAALLLSTTPHRAATMAADVAALTHGDPAAHAAAAAGVLVCGQILSGSDLASAAWTPPEDLTTGNGTATGTDTSTHTPAAARHTRDLHRRVRGAWQRANDQPGDTGMLRALSPDATAPAVLVGAVYAAGSFPGRTQVRRALRFAATAPHPADTAAVTGALLGALHGAEGLPVDLVSRLELAWVVDTLARDLLAELTDSPGGGEYVPARDPNWFHRYPGW